MTFKFDPTKQNIDIWTAGYLEGADGALDSMASTLQEQPALDREGLLMMLESGILHAGVKMICEDIKQKVIEQLCPKETN